MTTSPTTVEPLRCRLGRHAWVEQVNPETKERDEACRRCDPYREPMRLSAGDGTSELSGGGWPRRPGPVVLVRREGIEPPTR